MRWLLAVLLLMLVGLVVFVGRATHGPELSAPPSRPSSSAAPSAELEPEAAAILDRVLPPPPRPAVETPADRAGPTDVPTIPRVVRVIDATTGEPVPRAELWFLDLGLHPSAWRDARYFHDRADFVAELGQHAVANARGECVIAWAADLVFAVGRSGDRAGLGAFQASSDTPWSLELFPTHPVSVHVRHAEGPPAANVVVVLSSESGVESYVTTGPDGRARIEAPTRREHDALDGGSWFARVIELEEELTHPVTRRFRPEAGEVAELVLPRGIGGVLEIVWPGAPDGAEADVGWEGGSRGVEFSGGRAVREMLPLHRRFEITARDPTLERVRVAGVSGPRRPGEVVRVELPAGQTRAPLTLRIVDEAGLPLGGARVALGIHPVDFGESWRLRGRSDGEGRVRLGTVEVDEKCPSTEGMQLEVDLAGGDYRAEPLPAPARLAGADLGTVVLQRVPPAVAGWVLGPEDEPIPGARVTWIRETRGGRDRTFRRTDAAGAFSMSLPSSVALGDTHELAVEARGHVGRNAVPFIAGSTDRRIRLDRAGILEMKIADAERARRWAFFLVRTESGRHHPVRVHDQETLRFQNLAPGRVEFVLRSVDERFLVVPDVHIAPGEVTRDPRLDWIDLRLLVPHVRLFLHDPAGRPLPGVRVESRPGWRDVETDASGEALLTRPAPEGHHVLLTREGYRNVVLEGVVDDRDVELAPALAARVRVPGAVPLARAKHTLALFVRARGETAELEESVRSLDCPSRQPRVFDFERREAVVYFDGPGVFELRWGFATWRGGADTLDALEGIGDLDDGPTVVRVDEDALELEVPVPEDVWERVDAR